MVLKSSYCLFSATSLSYLWINASFLYLRHHSLTISLLRFSLIGEIYGDSYLCTGILNKLKTAVWSSATYSSSYLVNALTLSLNFSFSLAISFGVRSPRGFVYLLCFILSSAAFFKAINLSLYRYYFSASDILFFLSLTNTFIHYSQSHGTC